LMRTDDLPDIFCLVLPLQFTFLLLLAALTTVSAKDSGLRKFSEFVPDHFFGNEHPIEHFSVMDEKRMSYELRHNGTRPCPSFDRLFFSDGFLFLDLPIQFWGNERTFLN